MNADAAANAGAPGNFAIAPHVTGASPVRTGTFGSVATTPAGHTFFFIRSSSGGRGDTNDGDDMSDISDIKERLRGLETRMGQVEVTMATVSEKISHMPTTLKMWTAVVLTGFAVVGSAWALLTFAGPGIVEGAVLKVLESKAVAP